MLKNFKIYIKLYLYINYKEYLHKKCVKNIEKWTKIEYSKDSMQDLVEIKQYIKFKLKEPEIAQKIIRKIREEINNLKNNPERYATIDNKKIERLEIRKIIVKNYIVFYRIKGYKIQIVRVMYGRRDWIKFL